MIGVCTCCHELVPCDDWHMISFVTNQAEIQLCLRCFGESRTAHNHAVMDHVVVALLRFCGLILRESSLSSVLTGECWCHLKQESTGIMLFDNVSWAVMFQRLFSQSFGARHSLCSTASAPPTMHICNKVHVAWASRELSGRQQCRQSTACCATGRWM